MSSGRPISVSIQPLNYADISACARITSSAFSVDPHTIVKQLGRKPFDMYDMSYSSFLDTLHKKTCIYVKAVDEETGDIVGHAGWSFRGLDPALVPWNGPEDTKPMEGDREQWQGRNDGLKTEDEQKDIEERTENSIDRLHALEDADMQCWVSNIVPSDTPCIFIVGLIVSPSHQSRGVGSALIQHGNSIADNLGFSVWVHSSHQAYEAYKKFGFEVTRELDIDLDEYAPRGPTEEEHVMGEKGSGKWGSRDGESSSYLSYLFLNKQLWHPYTASLLIFWVTVPAFTTSQRPYITAATVLDDMILVPYSVPVLAAINAGISGDLATSMEDACFKKWHRVVFAACEILFSKLYLRNLIGVTNAEVIVAPPVVGFYSRPSSVDSEHIVE
ncbi:acyl-CoA N-acyltransferase [Daldinia bambusicola]|nr:acyl-CoA N-acyltransferase [Daldinia bambusicola]